MGRIAGKYVQINARVREQYIALRERNDVTLTEIANFIGCSIPALSIYESGKTTKIHEDILTGYIDYIKNFETRRKEMVAVEKEAQEVEEINSIIEQHIEAEAYLNLSQLFNLDTGMIVRNVEDDNLFFICNDELVEVSIEEDGFLCSEEGTAYVTKAIANGKFEVVSTSIEANEAFAYVLKQEGHIYTIDESDSAVYTINLDSDMSLSDLKDAKFFLLVL